MKTVFAEKLSWILIYSGLLLAVLGLFLRETQPLAALALIVAGVADVLFGAGLIWWRSRQGDPTSKEKP